MNSSLPAWLEQRLPSVSRERQIRSDALAHRLSSYFRREHQVLENGRHQLDFVDLQRFAKDTDRFRAEDTDLLLDVLPASVLSAIDTIAVAAPFRRAFELELWKAMDARGRQFVTFLPLKSRAELYEPDDAVDTQNFTGRNVLIFNPWRDAGFVEQVVSGVAQVANPIAVVVFIDCCNTPLERNYPVFSVVKKPIISTTKSLCPICVQVKATRGGASCK